MQLTLPAGALAGLQSFTGALGRTAASVLLDAALVDARVDDTRQTVTIDLDQDDITRLIRAVDADLQRPYPPLSIQDAIAWGTFVGAYSQAVSQPSFTRSELEDLFNILDFEVGYDDGAEPDDRDRRFGMRAKTQAALETAA